MNLAPAIALVIAGTVLAVALPPVLLRLGRRSPQLALTCWQLAAAAVLSSWLLACLSIGDLLFEPLHRLGHLLSICIASLQGLAHVSAPGTGAQLLGGLASAALAGWVAGWIGIRLSRERRARLRHAAGLRLVARRDAEAGIYILDSPHPAVYCFPGPEPMVVASTSALAELSPDELAAALAHEHAHLAHRDHLRISIARALGRALAFVPLFAIAADEVARLCELRADDDAARVHGHTTVAAALLHLLATRPPAPGLGAGGPGSAARVRRLLDPPADSRRVALLFTAATTAAIPFVALGVALMTLPYGVALCDLH
ncbi:M48 family metalloprotease [Longispora sp. NPDC051575]|uniref:M48 family metalloprotease n=1 Tax=Longispora sp. NPDC051575 TaxID=3154943 RepID=UPI003441299D